MITLLRSQPLGSLAADWRRPSEVVRGAPAENTDEAGSSSVSAIPIARMSSLIAGLHCVDWERPRWLRREKHALWYVLPQAD